jgi:hypothetical protein
MVRVRSVCVPFVSILAFAVLALSSSRVHAQTLNPTSAEFSPSIVHNNTMRDGTPIVSSYRLDLSLQVRLRLPKYPWKYARSSILADQRD